MATEVITDDRHLYADDRFVWLQTNRNFGNTSPQQSPDGLENREHALRELREYTTANFLVRMFVANRAGFIDLGMEDIVGDSGGKIRTDGFITLSPNHILHGNSADCGEITVTGFGELVERPVLGLVHAGRQVISENGHIEPLEYMCEKYGVKPEEMSVRLSPSIRKASYVFPEIKDARLLEPGWEGYVEQIETGEWSVDAHQRTIDDLVRFGVAPNNIYSSPDDTAASEAYFSNYNHDRGLQEKGFNGIFTALRQ